MEELNTRTQHTMTVDPITRLLDTVHKGTADDIRRYGRPLPWHIQHLLHEATGHPETIVHDDPPTEHQHTPTETDAIMDWYQTTYQQHPEAT